MKQRTVDIRVLPKDVNNQEAWREQVMSRLKIQDSEISQLTLLKRSIDARGRKVFYQLRLAVVLSGEKASQPQQSFSFNQVDGQKKVLIVGAGPCGYFCALRCLEIGLQPIVLDRGKDVQARRRDLRAIQQFGEVNPNSNYCFGEGGAGTYSDGKLYTRSVKRGNVRKALEILVHHGAASDILVDAHPHIGSNKLPKIISQIRATIEDNGGEVHFDTRVVDFHMDGDRLLGVLDASGKVWNADATVLCTGHSARDIYKLCAHRSIDIEFKPFAVGMRIEHPQSLIDQIQYNRPRGADLPAAAYTLSCQVDEHGVFSFCMCPGGLIVPASTEPGELVVNGMSLSRRDSAFANAAMVVTLDDNPDGKDVFGGLEFQKRLEQKIWRQGDGTQQAPAQRVTDFMNHKMSADLPKSSYIPGTYAAPLHELMPEFVVTKIKKALRIFDRKMKGYYTREAQFVGLESRTSAPVRIPRDKDSLMSTSTKGLFPGGEGAGFAGGILSAALDGERLADAVLRWIES